jgi:hypothetical protein
VRRLFSIVVLVCAVSAAMWSQGEKSPLLPKLGRTEAPQVSSAPTPATQTSGATAAPAIPLDENGKKAKALVEQAIQALGGQTYLTIRDREQQGRGYAFHHGRPSGSGSVFWSFTQFPDKERVEITKERDIAQLYVGDKAWEITYKGARPIEQKDLDDYLRRRKFSLDTVLRTWVNDPAVVFLYEGNTIAAQHPAWQVTLINAKNEAVTLYIDSDTHLPVKKSFEWRDPVDRQKNLEEEIYENYRPVQGIMAPYNVTRYFNGDMSAERFFNSVSINQGLDQVMFDPNSGYKPKVEVKHY